MSWQGQGGGCGYSAQASQASQAPNPAELIAAARAQGYSQEQARQYAQQYMHQWQQQQQQQQAPTETPDPQQLIAAALAQGYSQDQAQQYAQQYMQQLQLLQQQQQSQPHEQESQQQPAPMKEERVGQYANVPQILNIEEGRWSSEQRGQFRMTLKAVIVLAGRRNFQDVSARGPWRAKRVEAVKDQQTISEAFKFDGKLGVDRTLRELERKTWTASELEGLLKQEEQDAEKEAAPEEDDFDAEAEDDKADNEPEVGFDGEELPVKVRGLKEPSGPIRTWDEGVARSCVAPSVQKALLAMQMHKPTLIQRYALPLIANSSVDVLAQAQTGSGKTMAFVIPVVSRLLSNPPVDRPFFPGQMSQASPVALMLSPTRELAIQTANNVSSLFQHANSRMTTLTLYGGETMKQQLRPIEKGNFDVICATPGRLLDAIDAGKVSLSFASVIVLDEADQMLDLAVGLEGTVRQVMDGRDLPRNDGRQTLLFSATMPDFQTKQFHAVLKDPPLRVKLRVGHYAEDQRGGSCKHIRQMLLRVRDMEERWDRLGRDLMEIWGSTRHRREGKGIIFTNRISLAKPLESALRKFGISCGQLHGKQSQDVREDIVKKYRKGDYEVLIASNVASRGLDFPDVKLVVQFELPKTVEIYTHRIGRTGRNGQSGTALAYYAQTDWRLAKPLTEFLALNGQDSPGWLRDVADGRRRSRSPRRG
eukprot:TRINITY_DN15119_c2_g1_i3.p1 TRINITY_DN15119_c2_g1~~TRINITY_DN15119_c2_g1_i3.p1  ORF type:complete len:705 (+),score=142.67 TRINITY_DN15119_c2_g1_i3:48-2162(+)